MNLRSIPKKISIGMRMIRRRQLKIGATSYLVRGYLVWPMCLHESISSCEPRLDNIFHAALRCREGAFLDVGAHIGQTMLKLSALDNSRQYVGFEPQVLCGSMSQKLIEDNGLTRHTILPIGLSNENKVIKLFMATVDFDGTASMVQSFRPESFYRLAATRHHCHYKGHLYACVRNGDEVVAELELPSVAVIRIDVSGGEPEVIEGLSCTIQKHAPFIVFEVLNFYLAVTNEALAESTVRFRTDRIEKMETMLRRFGYEIYRIAPAGPRLVTRIQPESRADLSQSNYVAVPSEIRERFLMEVSKMQPAATEARTTTRSDDGYERRAG